MPPRDNAIDSDYLNGLRPLLPDLEPRLSVRHRPGERTTVDLVVVPAEISFAHGTGVLLTRMLEEAGPYLAFRAFNHYTGRNDASPLVDFVLPYRPEWLRQEITAYVARRLCHYDVGYILSVPYHLEDVRLALAAKAATGAPLAVYVMDDNCLFSDGLKHDELAELLTSADALFAISSELQTAYQDSFRRKFWVVPPLVKDSLIRAAPSAPWSRPAGGAIEAVMLGNVWHTDWLRALADTISGSGVRLTWLPSNEPGGPGAAGLTVEELGEAGITVKTGASTAEQIAAAETAAFVVVPTGTFAERGHALAIAKLSLPSRMPFVMATSNSPLLVVGHPMSGAAGFVKRFDLGDTSPYRRESFTAAAQALAEPKRQREVRERAFALSHDFTVSGTWRYLRDTTFAKGRPTEDRFQRLFGLNANTFAYYLDPPAPSWVIEDMVPVYLSLERLAKSGYRPDFVLDVGASTGIWSSTVADIYPDSRYVLVDPLFSTYDEPWVREDFVIVEKALSDAAGTAHFSVSADKYNSSLLAIGEVSNVAEVIDVEISTVDLLMAELDVEGRGLLKVDVQFAEHLVVAGAAKTLRERIDVVILELTIHRIVPSAKTLTEMLGVMDELGFALYDDVGGWRSPYSGRLDQKDLLFVRKGTFGSDLPSTPEGDA